MSTGVGMAPRARVETMQAIEVERKKSVRFRDSNKVIMVGIVDD